MAPSILVIFGATGDLTHRKLMPALYRMFSHGLLNEQCEIIGFARRPYSDEAFRSEMMAEVKKFSHDFSVDQWKKFSSILFYQDGRFEDLEAYRSLAAKITAFRKKVNTRYNKLLYLATPPKYYETILDNLSASGLSKGHSDVLGWTRVLIEKPFGKDLTSARALDAKLAGLFDERQIYRIDHYLGKETVQNIISFRFANGIFEPIWNKDFIDHVQITMAETLGVNGRGGFYEGTGALRDVMQNHVLTMLALTAMEQPRSFSSDGVRDVRAKAIQALNCIEGEKVGQRVVRGQYGGGVVYGKEAIGYRQEKDVSRSSETETFVAMQLTVDTARWRGVPWYLRTGKRLTRDAVEISLVFRQTCHMLFKEIGCPEEGNILTMRISPNEGIGIRVIAKQPGHTIQLKTVDMDFSYKESFEQSEVVEPYEKILEDAFAGDQMLFNRSDELEASWQFITKILKGWEKGSKPKFPNYPAGSWGPDEAVALIEKDGRKWILT